VAALGLVVGATVGVTLGMVSGYFGGWADGIIMRLTDIMLALPFILVAIVIVGVFGGSTAVVVIVVGLAAWSQYARIVRGEVLSLKQRDFVALARISGCGDAQILARHILPNITNTVIVLATLNVGSIILFESALSFLGMGVQPPTPAWGLMLAEGRPYISVAWWIVTFPGIALALTILGINFLGDWLRDRLDPKLRQL
jgi:peptide/nickel transport system permease protein